MLFCCSIYKYSCSYHNILIQIWASNLIGAIKSQIAYFYLTFNIYSYLNDNIFTTCQISFKISNSNPAPTYLGNNSLWQICHELTSMCQNTKKSIVDQLKTQLLLYSQNLFVENSINTLFLLSYETTLLSFFSCFIFYDHFYKNIVIRRKCCNPTKDASNLKWMLKELQSWSKSCMVCHRKAVLMGLKNLWATMTKTSFLGPRKGNISSFNSFKHLEDDFYVLIFSCAIFTFCWL